MSEAIFVDMISIATTVIKHPVDVVWPRLLDQAAWMKDFKTETVGGERNQEGEIKKLTPFSSEYYPFYFKTLMLIPFCKFVYKAYTENRDGKYGFTGIEVLSLRDVGKHSAIVLEAYLEFQSSSMTRKELADFVNLQKDGSKTIWENNFHRLAALNDSAQA